MNKPILDLVKTLFPEESSQEINDSLVLLYTQLISKKIYDKLSPQDQEQFMSLMSSNKFKEAVSLVKNLNLPTTQIIKEVEEDLEDKIGKTVISNLN